ncbi:MAG: DNA polymerase IV [Bifidobacteriaceae bacterium]|jgi:DNA polymerase-4|nr:DNA polymerase IV [Bifidobacteriaceae bacterium]
MARSIAHVDMDAFFASVELIERADLRGRPVIVAPSGGRGVVVAATYEARALGVHAGMPVGRARRAAPAAVFIPPHRQAYTRVSRGVMALLREVTPLVEQVSIDEAFLDLTGARKRLGAAPGIVEGLRSQIAQRFGVTASAGIGRSKSVAKIASVRAKPDGLLVVPPERTLAFLRPLPVDALPGIGPHTGAALARLGVRTVADLADSPDTTVARAIGDKAAAHLLALSRGQDDEPVTPEHVEKSISAETTFEQDLPRGCEELRREVMRLADKVAWRLRSAGLMCSTVGVKVRDADFKTHSRSHTLDSPTDSTATITGLALRLVASARGAHLTRLAGVRLENLQARAGAPLQETLGQDPSRLPRLDRVRDDVRRRFGGAALTSGTLIPDGTVRLRRSRVSMMDPINQSNQPGR